MERAGGGAMINMGCHCVEIIRNFVGKQNRPVEVMCWSDTLVHPVTAEDHAIALIRFESGAIGQIEVSWAFRGGWICAMRSRGQREPSGSITG